MLPARSSPSAPRPSSVSSSSSSLAPSVATERLKIQLVNRSQIQGPLHLKRIRNLPASKPKSDFLLDARPGMMELPGGRFHFSRSKGAQYFYLNYIGPERKDGN